PDSSASGMPGPTGKIAARAENAGAAARHVAGSPAPTATARGRVLGWRMPDRIFRENAAFVAREDIQQLSKWAVTVRHPVSAAIHAGEDGIGPLRRGFLTLVHLGASLFIEAACPGLPDEALRQLKLAGIA